MLGRVVAVMDENPGLALVGPVTNAAGNEQQIFTEGATPEAILEEGVRYANFGDGSVLESRRLGFHCVAVRRSAVERLGNLDEGYGLGYYEDFDYCLRARAAGLVMGVAESVFVYHAGGGSFKALGAEARALIARTSAASSNAMGPSPCSTRGIPIWMRLNDILQCRQTRAWHTGRGTACDGPMGTAPAACSSGCATESA